MVKRSFAGRFWLAAALSLILLTPTVNAFAAGRSRSLPSRHEIVVARGRKYHYRDGRFYRPGFFGFVVVVPPIGAVVKVLPFGHRTIIVRGVTYYYYDNVYYAHCPYGYEVVPKPLVSANVVSALPVSQPQTLSAETVTINVPNSNGSYTPVKLVKYKGGYIGPQGEYYQEHPTVDQLKALYGT